MLQAFDRLFERAAKKLNVECSAEEKEQAKKQFEDRFAALLESLRQVDIAEVPSEVVANMTPVSEAVIQARGQGGARQAAEHDVVLVSGNGGILSTHSTLVMSPLAS